MEKEKLNTSIKGKFLIAFLVSIAALYGAYWINSIAFRNMQNAINDLSHPHKKLQTVNILFSEIMISERLFKNMTFSSKEQSLNTFINHLGTIQLSLDFLQQLCADNNRQYLLVDSIKSMTTERQKLLLNYIKYRFSLKNNTVFLKQVNALDSLLSLSSEKADSLVFTSEHKQTITTIQPADASPKKKKKFWTNLFGRSSKDETDTTHPRIVEQEINVKTDTLVIAKRDTGYIAAKKLINDITNARNIRRNISFNKDVELAEFEGSFNNKVTKILTEVEKEVIRQMDITNEKVQDAINDNQKRVNIIIVAFFVFSAVILFFILTDITKSNLYRKQAEQDRLERKPNTIVLRDNVSYPI